MQKVKAIMKKIFLLGFLFIFVVSACVSPAPQKTEDEFQVLAIESFLADIAQQVAGDRLTVQVLIPTGIDPHTFEPSPKDIVRMTDSKAIIINGAGFEAWLEKSYEPNLNNQIIIAASEGLETRDSHNEVQNTANAESHLDEADGHVHEEGDPHFWLDPNNVIRYVENIRNGLSQLDPPGEEQYTQNATAYIEQLKELDTWIRSEVNQIQPENRVLITNHESFGYFADRYGFEVLGTIIPSVTTGSSPSPQQLTELVNKIREKNAKAVFLEVGSNPQLANQLASETGVKVVENLYTHSLTDKNGNAPSYLQMMRWNTRLIVDALR